MKKAIVAIVGLLALGSVPARAGSTFGVDVLGSFYNPRDTRWTGVGADVALSASLSHDLLVGYRVEELNVKGSDSSTTGAATGNSAFANSQITFQGIQGWWTAARAMEDKLAGDIGLWFGSANTTNFPSGATNAAVVGGAGTANPAATVGLSSPFIEPQVRAKYTSHGSAVDASFLVGFGYRFVRNWNLTTPFFNTAVAGSTAGASSSRTLTDFDGMDINAGFSVMF